MRVKDIKDIVFQDYCKPSMFICSCFCDWKCCIEQGLPIETCQNNSICSQKTIDIAPAEIVKKYKENDFTEAIVIGGLEPFLQFDEVNELIKAFRGGGVRDDIVIYTGYYPEEVQEQLKVLIKHENIIVKFGRYKPNAPSIADHTLGIELISSNQFAIKIS
jgi:hypothetical protein